PLPLALTLSPPLTLSLPLALALALTLPLALALALALTRARALTRLSLALTLPRPGALTGLTKALSGLARRPRDLATRILEVVGRPCEVALELDVTASPGELVTESTQRIPGTGGITPGERLGRISQRTRGGGASLACPPFEGGKLSVEALPLLGR